MWGVEGPVEDKEKDSIDMNDVGQYKREVNHHQAYWPCETELKFPFRPELALQAEPGHQPER